MVKKTDPEQEISKQVKEKAKEKAKETAEKTLVVSQYPQKPVYTANIDDKEYNLLKIEDALTEILEKVRRIDSAL